MRHASSANNWWLCSPNSGNSNNFCNVDSSGGANYNNANNSNLLAPGGCVREVREVATAKPQPASVCTGPWMQGASSGAAQGGRKERRRSRTGSDLRDASRQLGAVSFEDVFSFEHILECALECCKGVRWKASTQNFESQVLMWASNLYDDLHAGRYRSRGFNSFTIHERGKTRHIQSVHISERTVQKCLVRHCLRPLVMSSLVSCSYATLPGKGTEAALKALKEHLRWWYARHGRDGGFLAMDYHDYFGTISHEKLAEMYAGLPMDSRLLALTEYFINCFDGDVGVGLGSEISQISAVRYVSSIDHLFKDRLGFHCYARYMDDSYAIGGMDELREAETAMREASAKLGISLNERVTGIRGLDQGFRYLKKRILLTGSGKVVMRLERKNVAKRRAKLRENAAAVACGEMSAESEAASWQSWSSYAGKYDAHRTLESVGKYRDELIRTK